MEPSPVLKRSSSAANVAKLLKKTITKHNLYAAASAESPETQKPAAQLNGHATTDHTHTNGHAHTGPEVNGNHPDAEHQAEVVSQKHNRKKDGRSLATVTEETSGDGEAEDRYCSCSCRWRDKINIISIKRC